MLRSSDIHALVDWPDVLARLGIPASFLRVKKPGPCPLCGGTDRYVFDNRRGRGDYFCRRCGPGSGFDLLIKYLKEEYATVRKRVLEVTGLSNAAPRANTQISPRQIAPQQVEPARPTRRVIDLWRSSCRVEDCESARRYVESRGLWPLPQKCVLRAHVGVDYFESGQRIGRYAALLAPIRNVDGEFVSLHVTYLAEGRKIVGHEPRKILSPLIGHNGCAVRLAPAGEILGIAEGIESALSATELHEVPTWAALSTALMTRFEPPETVKQMIIFADNDEPGLHAAGRLLERLSPRIRAEIVVPPPGAKDWNQVAMEETP